MLLLVKRYGAACAYDAFVFTELTAETADEEPILLVWPFSSSMVLLDDTCLLSLNVQRSNFNTF